ncbi:MAG: DMT family transporter [Muribaculaceae bacterium]|nr:DMT family transporter [Muribaculaceae bacterium]
MKPSEIRGYALAAFAAAAYGTNPAFALPLYEQGMNPGSVLLFRYALGVPLLAATMAVRGRSFRLSANEFGLVAVLSVLMALSSLGLFESYRHMNSGVASTLLFVYPVMVAVLMMFFFHEKFRATVGVCLVLMCCGLGLLMKPQPGHSVSAYGCLLVMGSALTYALYIVLVNVSHTVRAIPTTRLLLYVLAIGCLVFLAMVPLGSPVTLPARASGWLCLVALAVIPTVLSLACTTMAIQAIGSTPTAILGALEPVSAVVLSVAVLGQPVTPRDIAGGALIVAATTLVVADKSVDGVILHVRKMFPRIRRRRRL